MRTPVNLLSPTSPIIYVMRIYPWS